MFFGSGFNPSQANPNPMKYGSSSTGRITGGLQPGMMYPSPFFDVGHTYLPTTVKQLFRFSRYYYLTNPIVATTAYRLAEYPVTDIWVKHEDNTTRTKWKDFLFQVLKIRTFQIECGLDYNVYGNAIITIAFPFKKHLACKHCGYKSTARALRPYWKMENFKFKLQCPKCKKTGIAAASDIYVPNYKLIRLIRHNPENIDTTYNDITGTQIYYYNLPTSVRNDIVVGRQEIIEETPQLYLQAIAENRAVIFNPDMVFHMKRPGLADQDRAWGSPSTLPVLKDLFLLQVLKKAQETIALEHVLPLRILFPQAGSGTSDMYTTTDLSLWRDKVSSELQRWKMDRNYTPILPIPVGTQTIGGDGRSMFFTQEITQQMETVLAGMGVMREFVYGGLSWSGSNASLRMLENSLLRYVDRLNDMRRWIIDTCAGFLSWPTVETGCRPFKMADDLQRKSLEFQLNQAGLLSSTTFLDGLDYDFEKECEIIEKEGAAAGRAQKSQQKRTAEIQGEIMLINTKYQAQAAQMSAAAAPQQQQPVDPAAAGAPPPEAAQPNQEAEATVAGMSAAEQSNVSPLTVGGTGVDIRQIAKLTASSIAAMPLQDRARGLEMVRQQSEELAELVERILASEGVELQMMPPEGVDMRPMPEAAPPQRLSSPA